MKIYNLENKIEYLDEVATLEYEEWAKNKEENRQDRIEKKKIKITNMFNEKSFLQINIIR